MKDGTKIVINNCIITVFTAAIVLGGTGKLVLDSNSIEGKFLSFRNTPNTYSIEETVAPEVVETVAPEVISKENPLKGIDVSYCQGDIDWNTTKDYIDFAVVRVGDAYNKDSNGNYELDTKFKQNMEACKTYGIDTGVYFLSRATNVAEAIKEANFVLDSIKDYDINFPVFLDLECDTHINMIFDEPQELQDIINAFMRTLETNGYYASLYSSSSTLNDMDYRMDLDTYDKWVANYGANHEKEFASAEDFDCQYNQLHGMHQIGDKVKIPGISNYVDMDFCYNDYPQIISNNNLNHTK